MSRPRQTSLEVPTSPAFQAKVTVEKGPGAGTSHVVSRFPATVGRGVEADVQLEDDSDDPKLSRHHLRILLGGGILLVEDTSTNGTWLGPRLLRHGDPVPVSADDPLWLGPHTCITIAPINAPSAPVAAVLEQKAAPPPALRPGEPIPLHVAALGRFEVTVNGLPVPDTAWETRKTVGILAFLAEQAGRPIGADELEEALWPDAESSRQALQSTISRIRRALRSTPDLPDPVRHERSGYRLSAEYRVSSDVITFEAACREAGRAREAGQQAAAEEALQRALTSYHGPFLDGYSEDWIAVRRRTLEDAWFECLLRLGRLREQQGRAVEAVQAYRTILDRDPCHEPAQVGLLSALHACGRRDEAMRHYHECTRVLMKTLGLPPGAELVALRHALLDERPE